MLMLEEMGDAARGMYVHLDSLEALHKVVASRAGSHAAHVAAVLAAICEAFVAKAEAYLLSCPSDVNSKSMTQDDEREAKAIRHEIQVGERKGLPLPLLV